jgi:hypothetical protein
MIRIVLFIGLSLILPANSLMADMSPMAKKHIFTPENISESKEEPPVAPGVISGALEKEILFTGVLISPKGKSVILSESVKNDKAGIKRVLKQGDQIKGMTIQEIGSNFVLLAGKENTPVKLNLYKGAKTRPAPVLAETKPEAGANTPLVPPAGAPKANKMLDAHPQGPPAAENELPSPFGGGRNSKNGKEPQQQSGEPPANPFADMLNKASQRSPASIPTNPFNQLPLNQ